MNLLEIYPKLLHVEYIPISEVTDPLKKWIYLKGSLSAIMMVNRFINLDRYS